MKTYPLNDGTAIPWIAFGTGTTLYGKNCSDITARALALGFTHLDGAQAYENEDSLGTAIDGHVVGAEDSAETHTRRRAAIYVTTKLEKIPPGQSVEDKLRESLRKLRTDYVDLFLVHNPRQHFERPGGIQQVWREMVDVKRKGLAKSIGVSNFNRALLEELVNMGMDVPAVNQIEYHPLLATRLAPLVTYHRAHDIRTAAFGGFTPIIPLRKGSTEDLFNNAPLRSALARLGAVLDKLAAARGSETVPTRGQMLLKWLQAEGVVAVTTSNKDARLSEYLAADALPDLSDAEKATVVDAVGDVQHRAFAFVPHMDDN
ncbi:hypothetical protein M0805_008627 [Coniferiporia weirii]|nr:hypothetical protein M0805_008627 [Coniferiporia weirii]